MSLYPPIQTLPMGSSATLRTQYSLVQNTYQALCLLDSNSEDALEQLLQKVGLSSDNLLATFEVTPQMSNANRPLPCRPPPQP